MPFDVQCIRREWTVDWFCSVRLMWARSRARADRGNRFLFARLGLVIQSATFGSFGQLLHLLTLHTRPCTIYHTISTYSITPRDSLFQHFTSSMDLLWNLRSHLSSDMENKRGETIGQVWSQRGDRFSAPGLVSASIQRNTPFNDGLCKFGVFKVQPKHSS